MHTVDAMAHIVLTVHDIGQACEILTSLRLPNELALCILDGVSY